jgi:hypothetical protein
MGDPNEALWSKYFEASLAGAMVDGESSVEINVDAARRSADKALAAHCERWPQDRVVYTRDEVGGMQIELLRRVQQFVDRTALDHAYDDLKRSGRLDAAAVLSAFVRIVHEETNPRRESMRYELPNIGVGAPFLVPERVEDRHADREETDRAQLSFVEALRTCLEALVWCGGSGDFATGAGAADGWDKIALPAIENARRVLGWPERPRDVRSVADFKDAKKRIESSVLGARDEKADHAYASLLAAAREVVAAYDDPRGLEPDKSENKMSRMRIAIDALTKLCEESP